MFQERVQSSIRRIGQCCFGGSWKGMNSMSIMYGCSTFGTLRHSQHIPVVPHGRLRIRLENAGRHEEPKGLHTTGAVCDTCKTASSQAQEQSAPAEVAHHEATCALVEVSCSQQQEHTDGNLN